MKTPDPLSPFRRLSDALTKCSTFDQDAFNWVLHEPQDCCFATRPLIYHFKVRREESLTKVLS